MTGVALMPKTQSSGFWRDASESRELRVLRRLLSLLGLGSRCLTFWISSITTKSILKRRICHYNKDIYEEFTVKAFSIQKYTSGTR